MNQSTQCSSSISKSSDEIQVGTMRSLFNKTKEDEKTKLQERVRFERLRLEMLRYTWCVLMAVYWKRSVKQQVQRHWDTQHHIICVSRFSDHVWLLTSNNLHIFRAVLPNLEVGTPCGVTWISKGVPLNIKLQIKKKKKNWKKVLKLLLFFLKLGHNKTKNCILAFH